MKRLDFADSDEELEDPLTFQITNIRHSDIRYTNIDLEYSDEEYDSDDCPSEGEDDTESSKRYRIQLFGVTKGGHTVQVDVTDFTPYFFVEVPDDFNDTKCKKFVRHVKTMLEKPMCYNCGGMFQKGQRWCAACRRSRGWFYEGNLLKRQCKLLEKEKMVGFTNHKKFKFVRLVFNNHTVMRKCSWMFKKPINIEGLTKKPYQFVCHESNIEPVMRFLHIQKIQPAGWVTVRDYVELQKDYSTCHYYVRSSFMDVKPATGATGLAPIMCAAFDIECTSKDGGFPKANRPEDKVIMVCTTFRKYPDKESCLKVCHTLKESRPIPGCVIEVCKSERDLLIKWRNLMQTMDPEFIYGYNSNGFDFQYMYDRAQMLRCHDSWLMMSRCVYEPSQFETKKLSSSALGDNLHRFVDMKGRIVLDVMKEIQKEHKLDMYKLDFVAEHFTGNRKEDLSPQELFANYHKGTKKAIQEIGVYCLKDTELCHDLAFKLAIIVKAMKMANVCTVPTEYIFYRGQGVKIFSLMANECRKRGVVMPVVKKPYNDYTPEDERALFKKQEQFQGALVIETDGGLYYDPIVVLDFNSLYPSCQIGWNMSHDTLVVDQRYDNLPGFEYNTVSYTDWDGKRVDCRYVCNNEETNKGIVPSVVGHLLATRKAIKKKLKEATGTEAMLLDCEQLAYKIVANSIFGQTGASTSPIYLKHIAACTTAKGREMLFVAKEVAEKNFNVVECVYGDSVMGYTPLLLRNPMTGEVIVETIENLGNEWNQYDAFKAGETNRKEKQQSTTEYEVWTDKGWSKIRRVIKHKTQKKIYRVMTRTGMVDVTEDHSLLSPSLEKLKPAECLIGTELLHSFPVKFPEPYEKMKACQVRGLVTCTKNDGVIPSEILSTVYADRNMFIYRYLPKKDPEFHTHSQKEAMKMYYLLASVGYDVIITVEDNVYILRGYTRKIDKASNTIKKITELGYTTEEFVYDLETECGRFHAGVGQMIVKNTDSNFYKVKGLEYLEDPSKSVEEIRIAKLKVAIELGHKMSEVINAAIGKPGIINFAYEKTFFPFLQVTKKRYAGIMYEKDPTCGKFKVMGLAIKRRNYCKYSKEIMQGLIDKMMANVQVDIEDIEDYIRKKLKALILEKVPIEDLVITNTLRAGYKNPKAIAHKCLADRMIQRGETVNTNDRIPYIYAMHKPEYNTRGNPIKKKIADIVEHPKYAIEHGIRYDPEIYITGQITEPVSQILDFVIPNSKRIFDEAVEACRKRKHETYGPPTKAPIKRQTKKKEPVLSIDSD